MNNYESTTLVAAFHDAADQIEAAKSIVQFLKSETNLKAFPVAFVKAITSNSYLFTNVIDVSNQLKDDHTLEPVVKFLAQIIYTCSLRAPNLMS